MLGNLQQAQVEPGLLRGHPSGQLEREVEVAGLDCMADRAAAELVVGRHAAYQRGELPCSGRRIARRVGGTGGNVGPERVTGHRAGWCGQAERGNQRERFTCSGNWGLHRLRARPS